MPRGAGGTSWDLLDSPPETPVTMAASRAAPTSRSPSGSITSSPRTRSRSRLVSVLVNSPRRTWKERPRASRESVKFQLVIR